MIRILVGLILIVSSSAGWASATGVYHSFNMNIECPGQEIFPNKSSIRKFNESFLKLMMSDESEECTMAYALNLTTFFRGLIYSGDKTTYDLYLNTLDEQYREVREKEKAVGKTCRLYSSDEDTPHCESDRLVNITQITYRVWYEFFKKDIHNQLAYEEAAATGGAFFTGFTLWAVLNSDVRSQSVRFFLNTSKHFTKILRATGRVSRSAMTGASRGAMVGRSAVVGRTAVTGSAGAGSGVVTSEITKKEEQIFVRSTDDFVLPFAYIDFSSEKPLVDKVVSYIPCLDDPDAMDSKVIGYRKSGCRSAMDLSIGLVAGILPAFFVQKYLYRGAVLGSLYHLGTKKILGRSLINSGKNAVKIGKSPVTFFLSGVAAGVTIGFAINYTYQAASYRALMNGLEDSLSTLKGYVTDKSVDPNNITTYFKAQELVSYTETLSLIKAAPMVDRLEKIKAKAYSYMLCSPLLKIYDGVTDKNLNERVSLRIVNEMEAEASKAFATHEESDEFADKNAEMLKEGMQTILETKSVLTSGIGHPGYLGLKSPLYDISGYLASFQDEAKFTERTRAEMKKIYLMSYTSAMKMYEFRKVVEESRYDFSKVSDDLWRGYLDGFYFFKVMEASISSGGQPFHCPLGYAYDFFNELDGYINQAPCDLGEEYSKGLKQCVGI